jgi:hypothetical protein
MRTRCKCGCGMFANQGRKYFAGHNGFKQYGKSAKFRIRIGVTQQIPASVFFEQMKIDSGKRSGV